MRTAIIVAGLTALSIVPSYGQGAKPEVAGPAASANTVPKKYYELTFVVRELEAERVINSRSYSIVVRDGTVKDSIRAGERVPFASATGPTTAWQQIEVGVNIDCFDLEQVGDDLSLRVVAEISSVPEGPSTTPAPIVRSNRWDSFVLVPIKHPTILFSSDDPASKRKMQLQLTVAPLH
jgi:hypothetical protein